MDAAKLGYQQLAQQYGYTNHVSVGDPVVDPKRTVKAPVTHFRRPKLSIVPIGERSRLVDTIEELDYGTLGAGEFVD